MSFDQQIKVYEDRILQLEEMKKTLLIKNGYFSGRSNSEMFEDYLDRLNIDLDENYKNMAILKIRKMMGF